MRFYLFIFVLAAIFFSDTIVLAEDLVQKARRDYQESKNRSSNPKNIKPLSLREQEKLREKFDKDPWFKKKKEEWNKRANKDKYKERDRSRRIDEQERKESNTKQYREDLQDRRAQEARSRQRHAAFNQQEKRHLASVNRAKKAGHFALAVRMLKNMSANGSPNGAYILGSMYLAGEGVKADKQKAITWFHRAADNGSNMGTYALGRAYLNGDGVKQDYKEAAQWFKKSKAPAAKTVLGAMYMEGVGVEKNYKIAWESFKGSHDTIARSGLGELCYMGLGMPKRAFEANKWFGAPAARGNPKALFYLSKMYATGDGVKKNEIRAKEYMSRYQKAKSKFSKKNSFEQQLTYKGFDDMDSRMNRLKKDSMVQDTPVKNVAKAKSVAIPAKNRQVQDLSKKEEKKSKVAVLPGKTQKEVYEQVEELVKKFYPKAKFERKNEKIYFEFKARGQAARSGKVTQIPKLGGIVGDITVTPGPYKGDEYLPLQVNDTLYVKLLMAPYSKTSDNHLLTHLKFPPNAPIDFVSSFKKLVSMYR